MHHKGMFFSAIFSPINYGQIISIMYAALFIEICFLGSTLLCYVLVIKVYLYYTGILIYFVHCNAGLRIFQKKTRFQLSKKLKQINRLLVNKYFKEQLDFL